MELKRIDELPRESLRGKQVLLRADFNVPLDQGGEVADTFRLAQGSRTVKYLSEHGAKVVVVSHIGRESEESLEPVARALQQFVKAVFVPDLFGHAAQSAVEVMKEGDVLLLENLRRDPRETENDEGMARDLRAYGEIYVDDAFAAVHRVHASIVGVAKLLPAYAGLLMQSEVKEIDAARAPISPSIAILGGAKFETKAPLVKLLLEKYDRVFITGALANDVFRARGLSVGRSLVSKELPGADVLNHPHFLAPIDVTVEDESGQARVKKPEEVAEGEKIVDIGPDSVALLAPFISEAKFLLWNGPTGIYEEGYNHYSGEIARLASQSSAKVVIGGGDTIASLESAGVKMGANTFLSTGGGAMLEYLLKGSLPGLEVLQ